MNLTPIEHALMTQLIENGPIRGTAQVGYAIWPDRSMQPQGSALAAGKVLRGLRSKGYVESHSENRLSRYEATTAGRQALAAANASASEASSRQLELSIHTES